VNSNEVAEAFGISATAAQNRLSRAHNFGWLIKEKIEGVFYYYLSQKAWDFYATYGSFIDHPWYGWGAKKNP
jgi:DNA-binding transcriptional regulator PaaX